MFLAATPYFQHRFSASPPILTHFQPAILSVSTIANLASMLLLTFRQRDASYPRRVSLSLLTSVICFSLLAGSAVTFQSVSPAVYFAFLLTMVMVASLATGSIQNGVFAYVQRFGRREYTQAIMAGQAIAGVLPCIARKLPFHRIDSEVGLGLRLERFLAE